ncbi:cell filamentation protein Fic [Candidatus Falkowbacteria bacterium RIFCSPLOWO2_12_FULL_45_13]|uniref:Cell filamentation protein Fic n=2 Tax=Bacteria TaxID=2 RepID=A0A1F4RAS5_UNCSA|nr:MAG: cell filamentation protein Fic [candidate division WOR-1 bacterium RIFCSPLOWO2_02_FULL_46_20]OGF31080.1 MAG: cell filamentation protein Fic [Candidatus Falkowbacteria bacterium RIFCSPLOWO2_12_FULL_45_13]
MKYIWEHENWPKLTWESEPLLPLISKARLEQGKLLTKVASLGFKLGQEARADILTEEAIKTSAIEGERLNRESVRSSVARHLGLPTGGLTPTNRYVDGLVEVLLDATQNYDKPLTTTRLKRWQAALFPTGQSGLRKIRTGNWRGSEHAMQVVSGAFGREKIHYEAPPGNRIEKEMKQFLSWWEKSLAQEEGLLRSGLAHFYFVTIHPFEDGNGRIARALTDMALAQDEKFSTRYYSLSSQTMEERDDYYAVLEKCQKRSVDITEWLQWYLECYSRAVERVEQLIANVLAKAEFWHHHNQTEINERQRKIINRLLDAGKGGFVGGLTTRKYVAMANVSRATAFREISDLLEKGLFRQNPAKGRSVSYGLNWSSGVR